MMMPGYVLRCSALLVGASLLGAWTPQETYSLRRKPTVGQSFKFSVEAQMKLQGFDIVYSARSQEKVATVDADGKFVVESSQSDIKLSVQGQSQPMPPPEKTIQVFAATGELLEIRGRGVRGDSYRLANMTVMIDPGKPVAVGDTWAHTLKADPKLGSVDANITYKVEGVETIAGKTALKVKFYYAEKTGKPPASAEGFDWIDTADGSSLKSEMTIKDAPMSGMPGTVSGTIKTVREGITQ